RRRHDARDDAHSRFGTLEDRFVEEAPEADEMPEDRADQETAEAPRQQHGARTEQPAAANLTHEIGETLRRPSRRRLGQPQSRTKPKASPGRHHSPSDVSVPAHVPRLQSASTSEASMLASLDCVDKMASCRAAIAWRLIHRRESGTRAK